MLRRDAVALVKREVVDAFAGALERDLAREHRLLDRQSSVATATHDDARLLLRVAQEFLDYVTRWEG